MCVSWFSIPFRAAPREFGQRLFWMLGVGGGRIGPGTLKVVAL